MRRQNGDRFLVKLVILTLTQFAQKLLIIFIFAILMLTKRRFSGEKTALYFFMYGVLRSFIEWLRVDSLMLFNVKISMVLSIVFAVVALGFIIYNLVRLNKKEE